MNYRDPSDWVQFVMKIRNDNDMIDHKSVVYAENETKLLSPIESDAVYIENETKLSRQIGQGEVCDEN